MTSRLAVMGRTATSGVAIPGRSLMSMNALLGLVSVCTSQNYEVADLAERHSVKRISSVGDGS